MSREMLVSVKQNGVAVVENNRLFSLMVETGDEELVGSIYKGRVVRVLPGMQAAFVDIGLSRSAFLQAGDVKEQNEDSSQWEVVKNISHTDSLPIQEQLDVGQHLMVQITKSSLGTKGARVTTYITLSGRYVVYMPTVRQFGVSKRIEKEKERERLKSILEKKLSATGGSIIRTAGEGMPGKVIQADRDYLEEVYIGIQKSYEEKEGVGLIHSGLDLELRALRDLLTEDVKKVWVDNKESYKKIKKFIQKFLPTQDLALELYDEPTSLFEKYGVDREISRSLDKRIPLKSGGSIVIEETEALVAIDVNTGKDVGKKDLEETILKTNLEAIKSIATQLRIRNCGGIIVIDFIDMNKEKNRDIVLDALKKELKKDRAQTQVYSMSELGLVEITRRRVQSSLIKSLCEPCSHCHGRGYVRSKKYL